jgi:DNA-binding transcriptional LysR family regulator
MQESSSAKRRGQTGYPRANRHAMTLEWSDFKVLLALARADSVAGAARDLQVDKSTISRRLAALEEAVGAKLLIRGGREFSWTREGRVMLEAAEATEAATVAALRAVRESKVDVKGSVRVSVAPAFVPVLMRQMIPALRQAHPQLSVELRGAYQRADLAKGDAEIAVRMARPEEPDLVARRAFDCGWFVFAATSYLASRGRPATFDELARHDLVLYAENLHGALPMRWMEAHAAPAVSRVDSLETACQAISAGAGIAVLPAFVADSEPALQRVFPDSVATNIGWIVYHESVRDAARVRVVADALAEFFQTHESMFLGGPAQGSCEPGSANFRA